MVPLTQHPASRDQVCEILRAASAKRQTLLPVGHGTKLAMGGWERSVDAALSLERMNRILDYPASDLTVTVEAGLPIPHLAEALAEKRQCLPLDIPFADSATVGGAIAANSSGPLRLAYGTWRDFVLGMQFVTADGKLAKGGGKVVKNVAGYDIPKLLIGSQGTLGVIVEVTLKVFPRPAATATLAFGFGSAEQAAQAARAILGSQMLPQALDLLDSAAAGMAGLAALCDVPFTLLAAAAGSEAVLARFERDLPALAGSFRPVSVATYRGPQEAFLWNGIREMTPLFLTEHTSGVVIKASLPFTPLGGFIAQVRRTAEQQGLSAAISSRAGSGIVYAYLWAPRTIETGLPAVDAPVGESAIVPFAAAIEVLLGAAEQGGGRAIVEWCPAAWKGKLNLWGTLGDDFAWMRKIKAALDPQGILSPGRFYGGI